ncbi:prolipoprotein diacylglyceryl transferase [Myxococcus sp. K15C18031901]|uniref:prolipoprotein diacylglyceryl transferase family protein n=1 Tax=Myxococcus dinghuensis TaxID=2906761 RepID=UPI0020A7F850|nr:prolipoprotein diacylglyceryl transferase family protein [Myxococcus dinghuensis]MCP3102756.1 prolipoprotein diacylglyceryl transferase [Myxococcus dinghuensis]
MPTHLLHSLNPQAFQLSESLTLRWTGVACLVGLLLAFVLLRRRAARGEGPFPLEEVSGFVLFAGLFGVILGGRAGDVLLHHWDDFSRDGSILLQFQQGGTSLLGVVVGVLLYAAYHARERQRSWLEVTDAVARVAPLGLLLGCLAAFAEGAPVGSVSEVPWAMRFPAELNAPGFQPVAAPALGLGELAGAPGHELAKLAREVPSFGDELERILPPRHPVLLYEVVLEGLAPLVLLMLLRGRAWMRPAGMTTGVFLVVTGAAQALGQVFREPDPNLPFSAQFESGPLLSLLLLAVGAAFILSASAARRAVASVQPLA